MRYLYGLCCFFCKILAIQNVHFYKVTIYCEHCRYVEVHSVLFSCRLSDCLVFQYNDISGLLDSVVLVKFYTPVFYFSAVASLLHNVIVPPSGHIKDNEYEPSGQYGFYLKPQKCTTSHKYKSHKINKISYQCPYKYLTSVQTQ